MEVTLDWIEIVERAGAAIVCGGILGWERESQQKPAGLRTQMLVALGAAAFSLVAAELAYQPGGDPHAMRVDQLRVVAGVITGIGFLGAGTIIQARGAVTGITTAATVWVVGALGTACGLGYYRLALVTVAVGVLVLVPVGWVEDRFLKRRHDPNRPSDPPPTTG